MAAAEPVQGLHAEATCPVCLGYFKDPVTTDCGHNFCQACLTRCHRNSGPRAPCPLCKAILQQGSFRPNRQLANIVEYVKKLEDKKAEGKWGMCETHEESLKLFCKDDEALICVVCDKSKEHQGHKVLPVGEAAQEYKEKIKAQLESLKTRRRRVVDKKTAKDKKYPEHLTELQQEKQKITFDFEEMEKLLKERKLFWLTKLEDLEIDIQKTQNEDVTRLSVEISRLSNLIAEMEEKCQQPESEFLQDIRRTLNRYKEKQVKPPETLTPSLEDTLRIYAQKYSAWKMNFKDYKESLEKAITKAYPKLILSQDLKCMGLGDKNQEVAETVVRLLLRHFGGPMRDSR